MVNVSELEKEAEDGEELSNYKVIIVGKTQVGKTKLLIRYKYGTYDDKGITTIGVDNHSIQYKRAKFTYYDTAGQDFYRAITSSFYRGSDACIIAYDVTSIGTFDEIAYYYNQVKQMAPDALIFIVGCKCDQSLQVSSDLVKKHYQGYRHFLTSSKENKNIKEMFNALEEELIRSRPKGPKSPVRRTVLSSDSKKKKDFKCC